MQELYMQFYPNLSDLITARKWFNHSHDLRSFIWHSGSLTEMIYVAADCNPIQKFWDQWWRDQISCWRWTKMLVEAAFICWFSWKTSKSEGGITGNQYNIFFDACQNLLKNAVLFALKNFLSQNDSFKHERIQN